jgi:HSP20 family molecular chaperone IbpA
MGTEAVLLLDQPVDPADHVVIVHRASMPRGRPPPCKWWGPRPTTFGSMARQQPTQQQVAEATATAEATMRPQKVPVNVYETSGALVIIAPLPAVTPSDVTIELTPTALRFWAHLRSAGPREYLVHEWDYGGYEREVALPDGYGSSVEASLTNGQLAIRVLRGEAATSLTVKPTTP